MRIFLSYARGDDEPFVARLADTLTSDGFEVWFDRRSMPSRALTFLDEIRRAIDGVDRVVAVMGPAAIRSEYVRCEWQYALIRGTPVVPVLRLGDFQLPPELRNLHCPDVRASRPWVEAIVEIRRVLKTPVPTLGSIDGLPSLPPYFRPRPALLSRIADAVLLDQQSPVNTERWQRVALLIGMGGVGKSVLAAAFARSIETRRAFSDGIYWLDMRRMPAPEATLESLAERIAPRLEAAGRTDVAAEQRLTSGLRGKRCLIVLDNVESVEQLAGVARCLDVTGRVLVTTRAVSLVGEAHRVRVDGLEPAEARQQLADWLQLQPAEFDMDCETILRACDGLPFAIALCGASIANDVARSAVAARLERFDLAELRQRFPDYEYPGLLPCLEVSVEAVTRTSEHAIACLERMVIFAAGAQIPEAAVFRAWHVGVDLDESGSSFVLAGLCSHSLLRFEQDQRTVSIHQLVHAYLTRRVPNQRRLHNELLAAYAQVSSSDWVEGPVDGYYYQHLVHHLLQARGTEPVCALLVGSPRWMERKLALDGGSLGYLLDVDLAFSVMDETASGLPSLAQLAAARHVGRRAPRSFGDPVLKALVALGLVDGALALARANVDAKTRLSQLFAIYDALRLKGEQRVDLLGEIERAITGEVTDIAEAWKVQLARRYAIGTQLDDAARVWHTLRDDTRTGNAWLGALLAERLAQTGRADEATTMSTAVAPGVFVRSDTTDLDAAEAAALGIEDEVVRTAALTTIVSARAQRGELELARATARAFEHPKQRLMALGFIPSEAALHDALNLARTLEGHQRAFALMQVTVMLARRSEFRERVRLRDRWRRWIGRAPAVPAIADTPRELLGEAERAVATSDPAERSPVLRLLALQADAHAPGDSLRLLEAARDAARAVEEPRRRSALLADVAADYGGLGSVPDAVAKGRALLVEAMAIAEGVGDPKGATRVRTALARALSVPRGIDLALDLVSGIEDAEERRSAMQELAVRCAVKGNAASVRAILAHATEPEAIAHLLPVALAHAGLVDEAMTMVPQEQLPIADIAQALGERGRSELALQLLDSAPGSDVSPYDRACVFAAMGRFEDALVLVNSVAEDSRISLFGPSPRLFTLLVIAQRMTKAGRYDEALALASVEAGDDEWHVFRASVLATVAAHRTVSGVAGPQQNDELFSRALQCARRAENAVVGGRPWRVIALTTVAAQLARASRWRWAFDIVSEAHFTIDPFLIAVSNWTDALETTAPGLSTAVLAGVAGVFGWQRPDLKAVAEQIADDGTVSRHEVRP
jgi:hypothetical protein